MAHSFQVRPVRVQSFALHKQAAVVYENQTNLYILRSTLRRKNTTCRKNKQKTIKLRLICGLFCRGLKYVALIFTIANTKSRFGAFSVKFAKVGL